jgi:hypothetical protein
MIKKIVRKRKMNESSSTEDLAYWLNHSAEERISTVEILRRQHYGSSERLQRVSRIIERT